MKEYKITKEDIWSATDNGRTVIADIYPQAAKCFESRRNFKVRPDDKNASCTVFKSSDGVWMVQDKGGSDTRAYTAIQLVMREQNIDFAAALKWIAQKYAPHLLEGVAGPVIKPKPVLEEVAPQNEYSLNLRKGGKFTDAELSMLGDRITQQRCEQFGLKPLDSYVTSRNSNGKSFRISATDNYPMYFYDYGRRGKKKEEGGSWGKIYQPLGDLRFMYYGGKVDNFIFGDLEFIDEYQKAKADPDYKRVLISVDEEGTETATEDKWKHLIICSGPSDALNVRNASWDGADYHVCWLNSETADLSETDFAIMRRLAENIYILYDIDETGLANMYRIAIRFLELKIIRLPEDLSRFRDRKGKPCKDAKDFFTHYRGVDNRDPRYLFADLVKTSVSLKFWSDKISKDKNGAISHVYDINNEQMYHFLRAIGYARIASDSGRHGYTFCRVKDNVVDLIDETAISTICSNDMLDYVRSHPKYYTQPLANTIYRSKQVSAASLEKMDIIKPDFTSWNADAEHFFFRNGIFRVTKDGVFQVRPAECPCMIYSDKIIPFDFTPMEKEPGVMPFFDIEPTEKFKALSSRLSACSPSTPEYFYVRKQIDTLGEAARYRLTIKRGDFTFLRYLYNTGRTFWRKEELNIALTQEERDEHDLHFINKVMALGYLLAKHKVAGQPYAVFCIETEQSDEGTHLGGTGKSLYASSVEAIRKQVFIDGQNLNPQKGDFMLQGVERGITDSVFIDDLNSQVDLHKFMPMITGKMVVNPKNQAAFSIDFKESPKVVFTSNHAIKNFDASLRRRTWFTAFSDYYHSDDLQRGLKERSPYTEFGKALISEYTPEEMNQLYNFMCNCLAVWKKIHTRINPPMKNIEKRLLQRALSDEFIFWAEEYFNEERLNTLVDITEAFEAYKATLNQKIAQSIRMATFKKKVIQYCTYKEWKFNPDRFKTSPSDVEYNRIHRKVDGKDVYYLYIDTTGTEGGADDDMPAAAVGTDDDKPIFG